MNILEKLSQKNTSEIIEEILEIYQTNTFWIVHYLYFANIIANNLLKDEKSEYFQALKNADFLLPDGIALQLFYEKKYNKKLHNLNGTDFSVQFLSCFKEKKVNLILYGGSQEVIEKAKIFVEENFKIPVFYAQNGYSEFDFSHLENMPTSDINILMVGLGTPKQELWIEQNKAKIQKYSLLAFSQWGTFDFWAGTEKRAPKIFLKLKLEWFWRFLTNPKKNFKKVYYSLFLFLYLIQPWTKSK